MGALLVFEVKNMSKKITIAPNAVFNEYKSGTEYKESLGDKGLFEQSKKNEDFYYGNQWRGAQTGNSRPLVRRNIIKRIGEYKLSNIASAPISVNYSADGVPDNAGIKEEKKQYRENLLGGEDFSGETDDIEIATVMSVLSDYFGTTAERVKFDYKKEQFLRNAYISGTAVAYTYWESSINTGLYADQGKTQLIKGDIDFQVLNVENVVFGDPNCADVQSQPFIIVSQRLDCGEVRREAQRNGITPDEREKITPEGKDTYKVNAGTYGENEQTDNNRVTVLTKFWKEWDKDGENYKVMCAKVTEKAYVRKPFDIGIKLYPFAVFRWSDRYSSIYGESDITYQIPNQIAINRALSAEIWAIMTNGMPMTIINGDTVTQKITNNPGQIIKVFGTNEDVAGAVRHLEPPNFSAPLINAVNDLTDSTLTDNGATETALGNIRPDNAAAIIQTREATLQPMQLYQNKFYSCIEDIARIWAEFWLKLYGDRSLKITDDTGSYYVPFHASRYENLMLNAKVDVGSSPIYSVPAAISILDSLYNNKIMSKLQYLERLPDGIIKDKTGLLEDAKAEMQAVQDKEVVVQMLAEQHPDLYAQYIKLPPEEQEALLQQVMGGAI